MGEVNTPIAITISRKTLISGQGRVDDGDKWGGRKEGGEGEDRGEWGGGGGGWQLWGAERREESGGRKGRKVSEKAP